MRLGFACLFLLWGVCSWRLFAWPASVFSTQEVLLCSSSFISTLLSEPWLWAVLYPGYSEAVYVRVTQTDGTDRRVVRRHSSNPDVVKF